MARPALLRRVPFTITATLVILALALASRGLWDPLAGRSLGGSIAYGLRAFEDGQVWTLATGAVFALQPVQYIPILLGFLAFGGFAEYRLGTGKAVLAFVACHVFAVVGTAALLLLIRDHGYQRATDLARVTDAGPSAGFLGAAAVASATLRPHGVDGSASSSPPTCSCRPSISARWLMSSTRSPWAGGSCSVRSCRADGPS